MNYSGGQIETSTADAFYLLLFAYLLVAVVIAVWPSGKTINPAWRRSVPMPRVTQKVWETLVEREVTPATAAARLGCSEVYAKSEMDRVRKIVKDRSARDEADRQLHTTWNYRG